MSKNKVFMSVTASAVIASTMFGAQAADAATYKVKPGDSLWSISQKYNTSVANLQTWNNLSNHIIFPNQVLQIDSSNSASKAPKKDKSPAPSKASTYTVKPGDSLSKIASAHGISLKNLMDWNNLTSTLIFPGDKFVVSKSAANSKPSNSGSSSGSSSGGKTYTVKSGDTLGKIAAVHGISLNNLMKWNNLSSHLIYPGDKLAVSSSGQSSSGGSSNSGGSSSGSSAPSNGSTYTVKSGDTLGKIASAHGISLSNLKQWNNLTSDIIYPGNKLVVSGSAAPSKPKQPSTGNGKPAPVSGDLISTAKSVLGVPYVWAGSSPSGFDCSGFIYWAFKESGQNIGGRLSTEGYYNRSYIVNSPQVGDLVFFEGTYKAGISHMGIYLGNNEFIHAGSSTGVTIANLNNSYWSKHFHSFKRFY